MDVGSSFSELLHFCYVLFSYALLQLGNRHALTLLLSVRRKCRTTQPYAKPVPDHPFFIESYPDVPDCHYLLQNHACQPALYSGIPLYHPSSLYRLAAPGASGSQMIEINDSSSCEVNRPLDSSLREGEHPVTSVYDSFVLYQKTKQLSV
jgi:hypothetical protein